MIVEGWSTVWAAGVDDLRCEALAGCECGWRGPRLPWSGGEPSDAQHDASWRFGVSSMPGHFARPFFRGHDWLASPGPTARNLRATSAWTRPAHRQVPEDVAHVPWRQETAEKELARLVTEVDAGGSGASSAAVAYAVTKWPGHVAGGLSPTTVRNYRPYYRRYIEPALGKKLLCKLTSEDLDSFYRALRRDRTPPLAAATAEPDTRLRVVGDSRGISYSCWRSVSPQIKAAIAAAAMTMRPGP
jgi:hypothetical protein